MYTTSSNSGGSWYEIIPRFSITKACACPIGTSMIAAKICYFTKTGFTVRQINERINNNGAGIPSGVDTYYKKGKSMLFGAL